MKLLLTITRSTLLLLLIISCQLLPQSLDLTSKTDTFEFTLPQLHECEQWLINWEGTDQGTYTLAGTATQFSLTIPKNIPLAIRAYPLTRHGQLLTSFYYPAGCVYPFEKTLTWQGGYTATLLAAIYTASPSKQESVPFCSEFNWSRITRTICDKEAQTTAYCYNPWLLDSSKVITAITTHSFTVYTLSLKNIQTMTQSEITTDHIVQSRYIPENAYIQQTGRYTISTTVTTPVYFLYDATNVIELYNPAVKTVSKTTLAISPLPL